MSSLRAEQARQKHPTHQPSQASASNSIRTKKKHRDGAFSSWWIISAFIFVNHVIAIFVLFYYLRVKWQLYVIGAVYSWLQLLAATCGYHRLWSHRSFEASLPLKYFLAIMGAASFQGSAKWWVERHRLHHRFTDTDQDPYDSTRGLFYSHYGWLLEKPKYYDKMRLVDFSDLYEDPVVWWQIKFLPYGYVLLGLVLPAMVGWCYDDTLGGILWVGVMARIFSWNGMFFTNSLAHWLGDRPYDPRSSARGSLLCAVLCNGEGNHNYHHEFPIDYRHGVKWYEWDPTKWFIYVMSLLGLARNLRRVPEELIAKAELSSKEVVARMLYEDALRSNASLPIGISADMLPVMTEKELQQQIDDGRLLVVLHGLVLDVTEFQDEHPGGRKILRAYKGLDATAAFERELNRHTASAMQLSRLYRVARLEGDEGMGSVEAERRYRDLGAEMEQARRLRLGSGENSKDIDGSQLEHDLQRADKHKGKKNDQERDWLRPRARNAKADHEDGSAGIALT